MTQPSGTPVIQEESGISGEVIAAVSLIAVETAFAAAVFAAYKSWLGKVAAAMMAVLPINPAIIWAFIPDWNRAVNDLMTDLELIARAGWNAAAKDLGVDTPFDVTNPVLQDQLRRTRNFMVETPDEVYRMILAALDSNEGNPPAQNAAVENILNITGTVNWPARSKTVAVTEVNRLFHFGSLALAMQARGRIVKKWIAREDKSTRPAHANADNQIRPVMQPFIVGGEGLMAPGDPSGSAWNVINCRCELSYSRRN